LSLDVARAFVRAASLWSREPSISELVDTVRLLCCEVLPYLRTHIAHPDDALSAAITVFNRLTVNGRRVVILTDRGDGSYRLFVEMPRITVISVFSLRRDYTCIIVQTRVDPESLRTRFLGIRVERVKNAEGKVALCGSMMHACGAAIQVLRRVLEA